MSGWGFALLVAMVAAACWGLWHAWTRDSRGEFAQVERRDEALRVMGRWDQPK